MKKIVLCGVTLQPENSFTALYSSKQESIYTNSKYEKKIYYPINAVLANELESGDEIKVVLISTTDKADPKGEEKFKKNSEKFITELKEICKEKDVKSNLDNPEILETEFAETKTVFENRYLDLFRVLENDCEIYADMTFGSRISSMILSNVLAFAEKFFNADIKYMAYGKTSFIPDPDNPERRIPTDGTVYDISPLYFINNLTSILKADSGEEAIEAFKEFLNLE